MIDSLIQPDISGVYAAVLTPRDNAGVLNLSAFEGQLEFLAEQSLRGFAINGATGEYPGTTVEELTLLLDSARRAVPSHKLLCGIGASNLAGTFARGVAAIEAGVQGLLLPMPYFFPYQQTDLIAYVSKVAEQLAAPILLYNLPQFTSGLEASSVLTLMKRYEHIVGVKDSSGSLEIAQAMTEMMPGKSRMIGNDGILAAALEGRVCDGVVSGVACALPELITTLYHSAVGEQTWVAAKQDLEEVRRILETLPTPWGLKVVSAERGNLTEDYPLPLSPERSYSIKLVQDWWRRWNPAWTNARVEPGKVNAEVAR